MSENPSRQPDLELGSYTAAIVGFLSLASGFGVWFKRSGRELPERVDPRDMALIALASHKLARLIARDRVTSPLRAPFTEPLASAGHGEVESRPRGSGPRRALGQMLVCPFCLGLWTSAGLMAGLLTFPRTTRWGASLMSIDFASDLLQLAYRRAEDAT